MSHIVIVQGTIIKKLCDFIESLLPTLEDKDLEKFQELMVAITDDMEVLGTLAGLNKILLEAAKE